MSKFLIKSAVLASVLATGSAFAVDPVKSDITCEQLREKYEMTAEAEQRFAQLQGACEGVYDVDGKLYVGTTAVVRGKTGGTVRLYLPATDKTIEVTPDPDGRVWVGSQKMEVRDLERGDELGIYLSVDKFAQEKVDEISFVTVDTHRLPMVSSPVSEVEALPTTATPVPLLALLSALVLGAGLVLRRKI